MFTILLFSLLALAADVPGGADHPLVRRYEGSTLLGYRQLAFDSFSVPLGPVSRGATPKVESAEGHHTRLLYASPAGRSALEVFENYAAALKGSGFETRWTCAETACGTGTLLIRNVLYPRDQALDNAGQVSAMAFSQPSDTHYLAARLRRPEGDVTVSLFVAQENFASWKDQTWNRALVLLDIVEAASLQAGKVVVDASAMADDLSTAGRVALYGVEFESNSTALSNTSMPTLNHIAQLLRDNPNMKLHVVGHTDNVGGLDANLDLSRRRAESVVAALTSTCKVDPARLRAAGVGPLAPVAPNTTEAGRARNRRVELVPQ